MSTDTITLTRQGERWFAIDEETGLAASGRTREKALDSLDEAVAGRADEVAIVRTPGVLHGQPRIDGTRFGVFAIGESVRRGDQSVDDVLDAHPDLSDAQAEAALAYYDSHPDEMGALRDEESDLVSRVRERSRSA